MKNEQLQSRIEEIMTNFKDKLQKVQDKTIGEIYCDMLPYFQDDLISNIRTSIIRDLKYSEQRYGYDFVEIRKKILKENRDELIEDLNQDNLNEIKRLQEWINELCDTQKNR